MHTILLVIPKLDGNDYQKEASRESILMLANQQMDKVGAETLSQNCWLIPVDTGYGLFCQIVGRAEHAHIPHKSIFFEEAPKWIPKPSA